MKNKKGFIQNPKILLAVLLIGTILYFGSYDAGSIIQLKENGKILPTEKGTFSLGEYTGEFETIKKGCLRSSSQISFNGENDGDISLCNEINSGQKLTLKSSLSTGGSFSYPSTNYIKAKIKLPAGKIRINYNYLVDNYYSHSAWVSFNSEDLNEKFSVGGSGKGHRINDRGFYEFRIDKEKEIELEIKTYVRRKKEDVMGEMIIEFSPDEKTNEKPEETKNEEIDNTSEKLNLFERLINAIFGWFTK